MLDSPLSEKLWPVHIKPQEDELLTSWLMRLSMAHGMKLHTFCSTAWPQKAIWNRDIDKSADSEIIRVLSERTGTQLGRVRETTLAAYEGILYQTHNHFGPTSWIMPVGIYHRTRRQFGLQYCPRCLAEDKYPYYRRKWRLAFIVVCEKHHLLLHDRCPQCEAPINFHRNELGDFHKLAAISLTHCYLCNFDLREADQIILTTLNQPAVANIPCLTPTSCEVEFTKRMLRSVDRGFARIDENITVYSVLFFAGLRQLMKVLAMRNKRLKEMRANLSATYSIENYLPPLSHSQPDLQELNLQARKQLLGLAGCLLTEWPHRFVEFSRRYKVWSSLWLRHLEPSPRDRTRTAPFWLWRIVYDYLYRARYCPSDEEINEAIKYLRRIGEIPSKSKISRLLGVAVIRRKDLP